MITILKHQVFLTMFDLVGSAQEEFKGRSFCSLVFKPAGADISLIDEPTGRYVPPTMDLPCEPESSDRLALSLPESFEHFLQLVRTAFPGIGFRDLGVSFDGVQLVVTRQ